MVLILVTLREHSLCVALVIASLMVTLVATLVITLVSILLVALITHIEWSLWMLLHLHICVVVILELGRWSLPIQRLLLLLLILLRLGHIATVVVIGHHILPIHVVACLLKFLSQHQRVIVLEWRSLVL